MTCKHCDSDKLAAICWEDFDGKEYWNVYFRCGNCQKAYWQLLDQEEADALDEVLDAQQATMWEVVRDLETTDVLTTQILKEGS